MNRFALAAALMCGLALPGLAAAQAGTRPPATKTPADSQAKTDTGAVAAADQAFVKEAAMGGMAEVDLGKLAASKAENPDVKQFGQRMVDDHGKANSELKNWASQKNVTLPNALDAKHQAEHDRLEKLSGAAFDRAYMASMVADHNKDVAAFMRESKSAKDPDLKAWAGKTLPTLQEHQKMAKEINAKVGGAKTKAKAKTEPKK
jgi:putative membrane protein